MTTALITGITGQDGSYLAELLLEKDYDVHGIARRTSLFNRARIEEARSEARQRGRVYELHYGDLGDSSSLNRIIGRYGHGDFFGGDAIDLHLPRLNGGGGAGAAFK